MKTFTISNPYGGLGDHLFFSHLPRIAKQFGGYENVLIAKHEFRHPSYRQLVWESNPWVDGFCEVGDYLPNGEFGSLEPGMNLLDRVMLERGLDDGKRFHEPEVHYRPKLIPELHGKSVFDGNWVSNAGDCIDSNKLESVLSAVGIDYWIPKRNKSLDIGPGAELPVPTPTVFEYADVIASCERFYCLTSGGATLAAALGRPATVFFWQKDPTMFCHSRLHAYVSVGK